MAWDFSDYSGESGEALLPLLISERSQALLLAAMYRMQHEYAWVEADFDEISESVDNAIYEIITEATMDGTPVGAIAAWVDGNTMPPKWVECNDNQYFQDEYPDLYALIGDTYDYDDDCAEGRFYAPRLYNRFIYGRGSESGEEVGARGGEATHTLTIAEIPAHNHSVATRINALGSAAAVATGNTANSSINTGNAGSGNAHNNMPPFVRLVWMIKALP